MNRKILENVSNVYTCTVDYKISSVAQESLEWEYVREIYSYLRHLETENTIPQMFLNSKKCSPAARAVLVDWIVQIHMNFKLHSETLFIGIQTLDRFLKINDISSKKLQLAGVTALFIAAKYEEIHPVSVSDLLFVTDDTYSKSEILKMECKFLQCLDMKFGYPTSLYFFRRYSKVSKVDSEVETLARYFMELTLSDYKCVHILPSLIAAAALYLSMCLKSIEDEENCDNDALISTLQYYSKYKDSDLLPVACRIAKIQSRLNRSKLTAVRAKYSSKGLMRISHSKLLDSKLLKDLAKSSS